MDPASSQTTQPLDFFKFSQFSAHFAFEEPTRPLLQLFIAVMGVPAGLGLWLYGLANCNPRSLSATLSVSTPLLGELEE
jgi:hypothetical protein